jgi:FkbM family methyltransferase
MAGTRRPSRARAAVAEGVQRLLHSAGYELHAYPPPPSLDSEDARRALLLESRRISVVLDVGANAGQFGERLRAGGYGGRIVSFEPLSAPFERLAAAARHDEGWEVRRTALGEADGAAEVNVSANSYSSSLLPMRDAHRASAPESGYVGTETVPVARLDTLWDEVVRPGERVWLKLDVQGFEPQVLRGAGDRIDAVECVQTEMAFVSLYEGDVGWRALADWLADRGFRLAGFEAGFCDRATGEMLQGDGIFVRDRG